MLKKGDHLCFRTQNQFLFNGVIDKFAEGITTASEPKVAKVIKKLFNRLAEGNIQKIKQVIFVASDTKPSDQLCERKKNNPHFLFGN